MSIRLGWRYSVHKGVSDKGVGSQDDTAREDKGDCVHDDQHKIEGRHERLLLTITDSVYGEDPTKKVIIGGLTRNERRVAQSRNKEDPSYGPLLVYLFPKCIGCSGEPCGISKSVQTGINSFFVPLLYRQ